MRRRIWRLVAAAAVLLRFSVAAPAAADVSDYLARPIAEVALSIDGRVVHDPRLLELIETRSGQPLAMAEVRESITHLFSLGRFEDVRVEAERRGDQVAITFVLVPLGRVRGIDIDTGSAPGIDTGTLKALLATRFGVSPPVGRLNDMARAIEESVKNDGYFHAVATPRQERVGESADTRLRFAVNAGPRARIGALEVEGEPGVTPAGLYEALDVRVGGPYEREKLASRLDRFVESRRRLGFYDARVTVAARESEPDVMTLTFTAAQGPHVRVEFAGDPMPADRRDDLVSIVREGSIDEDVLEDSTNRIEAYLRGQGYRDAVAPHSSETAGGERRLTFTVHKGPLYRVARVEIAGGASIPLATLQARLRIRAGQPFSESVLDADVAQVADLYRREGFAQVQAQATSTPEPVAAGEVPMAIAIEVREGVRTVVNSIRFEGALPSDEATLPPVVGLQIGRPYFASQLAIDRDAIQLHYANLGYPSATVAAAPGVTADGTQANVVFTVRPGARVFVDHVLIIGNERTRTSTIERELRFKPGDPLGLEALNESQRRLASLGLFRRARLTELGHGDESRRDVLVTVEEAPVTTVGYGGGLEVGQRIRRTGDAEGTATEQLEFAPRAFFEVGRRNLFGKNRSVNLFTRVSLRRGSADAPTTSTLPQDTGRGFSEYRVIGTFREPRVVGTAADAFFTGTLEQQARSSFNFSRRAFNAEVARRLTPIVSLSGSYQIQRTELFDEQIAANDKLLIDRAFPQVRLSSFSGSAVRDTRDDLVDPLKGQFFSANSQLAARAIGSEVGFIRTFLTAQTFRPMPRSPRTIFAASVRLGLATGFPRQVPSFAGDGTPIVDDNGMPVYVTSRDLPASERFFAGGDTTVRGFALDQLGTAETIDKSGFPIGGRGLVVLNAELRVPVHGGLGVVGFIDAGNVFASATEISLAELRGTVGFGVRYKSPIGPIRVDLGFKTDRRDLSPGNREPLTALHISLGQAF